MSSNPPPKARYVFRGRPCRINSVKPGRWSNGYQRTFTIEFLDGLLPSAVKVGLREWVEGRKQ